MWAFTIKIVMQVRKVLKGGPNDHYSCYKCMPRSEPVGWDAEKEEEVLLERSEKVLKIVLIK